MRNTSSDRMSAIVAGRPSDPSTLIGALEAARRVHDRLDWWRAQEWAISPAWSFAGREGGMLMVPVEMEPADSLNSYMQSLNLHSTGEAAWLRWCAVADGSSASGILRALFADALRRLDVAHVASAWVISTGTDWLAPYLRDAGFERVDRMLTYEIDSWAADAWQISPAVDVRATDDADLNAIIQLDNEVFGAPWKYGRLLRRAYQQSRVFIHAVVDGVLAGYACAVADNVRGHVVRLAVGNQMRRRGVGTALLGNCLRAFQAIGVRKVTLNTQNSNVVSQDMYRRLGFQPLIEQPSVLRLLIQPERALREAAS